MIFGIGPVLRYELITSARRGRYFVARLVYGLILLYCSRCSMSGGRRSWRACPGARCDRVGPGVRRDGAAPFGMVQGLALLCLVPALVAGVIADEHQRKTLHYLLASRLSSPEIVLGKLGARLLHVGVFVAVGLPVVCLLALYGALNPVNVCAGLRQHVHGGALHRGPVDPGLDAGTAAAGGDPGGVRPGVLLAGRAAVPGPACPRTSGRRCSGSRRSTICAAGQPGRPLGADDVVRGEVVAASTPGSPGSSPRGSIAPRGLIALQGCFGLLFLIAAIAGLRPLRGASWPGGEPRAGWFAAALGAAARGGGRPGGDALHPQPGAGRVPGLGRPAATARCSGRSDTPRWGAG